MIFVTVALLVGFAVALPLCIHTKNDVIEAVTITLGVALYHFVMRLCVGALINLIMKNKANPQNAWFREKSFERGLYKLLRVRRWRKYVPTYSPETFDPSVKTTEEIVGASCQAEVVHEIIMVLSLLPIAFIPLLGGAAALIITSVLSMLFDSVFVILQRYNRPKLLRVMGRFERLTTKSEQNEE